jgi:DNA-binding HxlR family transcriptional regulator
MPTHDGKQGGICPVARVAELLGDPCTLLLVRDLLEGEKRFKDFSGSLSPISTRTIASKLKLLEEHGLVARKEYREKPPRVEYKLTPRGKRLHAILEEMRKFGKVLA